MLPVSEARADVASYYTYTYDIYDEALASPDAYKVQDVIFGSDIGIGNFNNPMGIFAKDELVYILDTGNNRIVVVNRDFELVKVIESVVIDGEESELSGPQDIFIDNNGDMYICDTANQRILHTDKDLNFIRMYTKPDDEHFAESNVFSPTKCVADEAGRLYVLATNVNRGLVVFDSDGEFTSFMGANPVKASFFDVLKKRLMTKEQRQRMIQFVPTEYSNVAIDSEDFIYATTTTFNQSDLINNPDRVNPIRKLNSLGDDILIKNGYYNPIGDMQWGTAADISGPSRLTDVTALDNDTYFAIDRVRGRIFGYDFQGNLLYAFGGVGNRRGYFEYPIGIESIGTDLLVLDNRTNSVTRFTLTEYGKLINNGLLEYKRGRYDQSAEYFRQVLEYNGNYDLAYIGIGRALLRQEEYEEAMKYFKVKKDYQNYSKAFQQYRKEWVEANIGFLVAGLVVLFVGFKLLGFLKRKVWGGANKE